MCCAQPHAHAQYEAATAFAPAIESITIDGKLDDWPDDLQRHPVLRDFSAYGITDLYGTDLATSADLSPWFMTAYHPTRQLIYLAVVVRDDVHIVGQSATTTDAIEVYVDGNYYKGEPPARQRRDESPQYVGVAGDGAYFRHNPALMNNPPPADSGIAFAHSREGDVTIYEFALRAYERYPNRYATIEPGKRVGFEVVVVDKDGEDDAPGFIAWSMPGPLKHYDARLLGDMVFVEQGALRTVRGEVLRGEGEEPFAGLVIEAHGADGAAGFARTDEAGRFSLQLPPGEYRLRPARGQGASRAESVRVDVATADAALEDVTLRFEPLVAPDALARALERYGAMQSYRDQTLIEARYESSSSPATWAIIPLRFAFARPNRLLMQSAWASMGQPSVISDGEQVVTIAGGRPVRGPREAPAEFDLLSLWTMTAPAFGTIRDTKAGGDTWSFSASQLAAGLLPHRILALSMGPADLLRHAHRVAVLGPAKVDGQATTLIEITLPTVDTAPHLGLGDGLGGTMRWQLWIDDEGLIRKSRTQTNIIKHGSGPQLTPEAQPTLTLTATHRQIEIDPDLPDETFTLPGR